MNTFWKNIIRYPRFFISSLLGLIFVILTPIKSLFKISKFKIFFIFGGTLFILFMYIILTNMSGEVFYISM